MDEEKIATLDAALIAAVKGVRLLSSLAWPAQSEEIFLRNWRAGRAILPEVNIKPRDLTDKVVALEAVVAQCNQEDVVEKYLYETAHSYITAARMLGAIGGHDFTKHSVTLYGRPDQVYKSQGMTSVDAARFFLNITDDLLGTQHVPPLDFDIPAEQFAEWLRPRVDEFFEPGTVAVKLDPDLSAKAIAGASRIRIRSTAMFSKLDKNQLLNHEAFVHTGTMQNARRQTKLKSLSLGAPRTTRTQEGIAVLSELFTGSMDIARLRRIALRVLAVQQALDGADFIDVFKFFLESGQSEEESVRSTQRIFRGGAVKDGIVFTKDAVYLNGLLEVNTFLRIAIRDSRPELIRYIFAGRLTLADVLRLSPLFLSGWLEPPRYVPAWAADVHRISALLAYSVFVSNIRLEVVQFDQFIALEERLKTSE